MENVIESLRMLKELNKKIYFLTNNTTYNKSTLINNNLISDDIITPTDVIINYLKSSHFNKEIYVIGSQNMKIQLKRNGFKLNDEDVSYVKLYFQSFLLIIELSVVAVDYRRRF